jgi:hypothetical protein
MDIKEAFVIVNAVALGFAGVVGHVEECLDPTIGEHAGEDLSG